MFEDDDDRELHPFDAWAIENDYDYDEDDRSYNEYMNRKHREEHDAADNGGY